MAEQQKIAEVPVETTLETTPAPIVEAPVETKPTEEIAKTEDTPVVEDKTTDETKPAETEETAEAKEDVKPIEEGHLSHKAQGLSFPKNLIPSKEFFFFGSEAVEAKVLAAYLKAEKSAETAHSNIAWATETGKGLLFVGDKKAPSSVISLADATEPETDGSHKFHLTSKGNKHTFKATTAAERDNWVAQLKAKIAEAKELAVTVTESKTYKSTLEGFKPAPVAKKEEKPVEAAEEEAVKTEEVTPVPAVVEETPKEEEIKDERKKEEVKSDEPKRRSASRKRASFFGFGKKEDKKEETKAVEETPVTEEVAPVTTEAVVPVTETPKIEETAPVVEAPVVEAPVESKPAEETPVVEDKTTEDLPVESPKEKPTASKRNSFFGVFSKKEKKTPELKPTEPTDAPKESEATENAPVIPPVEATTPLAVDVSSPANVPTETIDVPAISPPVEAKKDLKEKRKSSLPFAFGKRDKSPAPVEGEEKSSKGPFSKLRATINRKTSKSEEKPAEDKTAEEAVKEETPVTEEAKTEEVKPVEETPKTEETKTEEVKPDNVATTTPAVTAAA
ncbi:hypothetical protein AK830_g5836 [Neonectria ditissima]|uniref:PH domain-containing protein n=1 Tax=Neonectria ditissima TaxID=78410 RepID=A0A0P7BI65_9HYPO|nr:hypothetical protein AK830_g5836 [Neonectria ditissima]